MHVPDGFLSLPVAAGAGAASATAVAAALRKCRTELDDRAEALLGVTAAGVFAAQMVNFPIPGGASGHLLGATLAGILLGPWGGMAALTCVLIVQCLLFADGGLLALGANIFNMGVIGCGVGSSIWMLLRPMAKSPATIAAAAGIAAWCSTLLAAAACTFELSWSGAFRLDRAFPLMVGVHALIGVAEAVITGLVVAAWLRYRRTIGAERTAWRSSPWTILLGGLALAATIVVGLAPFSSQLPDGLHQALTLLGVADLERQVTSAWFAGYEIQALGAWSGAAAGLLGVGVVTAAGWLAARGRTAKADASAARL